jgi:hypothetical protein
MLSLSLSVFDFLVNVHCRAQGTSLEKVQKSCASWFLFPLFLLSTEVLVVLAGAIRKSFQQKTYTVL